MQPTPVPTKHLPGSSVLVIDEPDQPSRNAVVRWVHRTDDGYVLDLIAEGGEELSRVDPARVIADVLEAA